jgi:hypothetical protein
MLLQHVAFLLASSKLLSNCSPGCSIVFIVLLTTCLVLGVQVQMQGGLSIPSGRLVRFIICGCAKLPVNLLGHIVQRYILCGCAIFETLNLLGSARSF